MGKTKQSKSLNLAVFFIAVFVVLILISLILKISNAFQESIFDGENHFALAIKNKTDIVSLISLSPKSNAIYILNIKNAKNKNLRTALEIPIDSEIYVNSQINEKNIKAEFFKFLVPFSDRKTSLNTIDLFRLWLYVNLVPTNSIYQQEILASNDQLELKNLGIYSYFVDQGISEEKIPIEIINGTSVFGLGNKLASFLSNMGANVIMVSTSEKDEDTSRVDYINQESYTLKKLVNVLGFKPNLIQKKNLGEITIVIGKDALGKIKF